MKVTFKVFDYKFLEDPFDKNSKRSFLIVDIVDIPNNFPMKTNPRNQKMNSTVVRKIVDSLCNVDQPIFHILNRGITLSAKSIVYNEKDKTVTIDFENELIHGDIDGGHTYKAIIENQKGFKSGQQFCTMEVITGDIIETNFTKLASTRNTSQQVSDKSIAELEKRFAWIQNIVKFESFEKEIIYKENDTGSIDISDIIVLLSLFNVVDYPGIKTYPMRSYNHKTATVKTYIELHKKYGETLDNNIYRTKNILLDIIKLYDFIETNFEKYYRKNGSGNPVYGKLRCIKISNNCEFKSLFYQNKLKYKTPKGFIVLALSALRAIIKIGEDGFYEWEVNPYDFIDKILTDLSLIIVQSYRELVDDLPKSYVQKIMNIMMQTKDNWRAVYREAIFCLRENYSQNNKD